MQNFIQQLYYLKRTLLGILMLFIISGNANAQLNITLNNTATDLVNKLVGTGVTTFGASLSCKTGCSATFEGTSNLGIDSGILLVTGNAKTSGTIFGVDAAAANGMSTSSTIAGTDLDLNGLASPYTHNNDCILEFKFVPAGDTIKFEYVFGSEEYPEYACTQFNDVFAFLVSGPGIVSNVGWTTTKRNIALVPGTTNIPVAINSINSGVGGGPISTCSNQYAGAPYTAYYVNNAGGTTVVFDGFTTVLTAVQNVVPCDTYTLKMAIADVSDGSLNSGVFIKAGSLKSVGLTAGAVGMEDTTIVTNRDTAYIVRGCPPAIVSISRDGAASTPLTVPYTLSGDAVNGVDYQYLSGTVTIPANQTTGTVVVRALPTVTPGPNKVCIIKFYSPYSCQNNGAALDSAVVLIQDSIKLSPSFIDTSVCFGQVLGVHFDVDTIFGPLNYEWIPTTGVVAIDINDANFTFPSPGFYQYQYRINIPTQDTNCRASTVNFNIEVQNLEVYIGNDTSICSYDNLQMFAVVDPQDVNNTYQYSWMPANYFNNPTSVAPVILAGNTSTNIIAQVTTDIGCVGTDTIFLTVNPGEFVNVSPSDTGICQGSAVIPNVYSTLLNTPLNNNYLYSWTPTFRLDDPTNKNQSLMPETNTKYRLIVENEFGCFDTSFVDITVHPNPSVELPELVVMWLGETHQLEPYTNAVNFSWFPVSGINNPNIANPLFSPIVNTRYFYTATTDYGCSITDSIDFIVNQNGVIDMPNAFNPNNGTLKPVYRGNFTMESFEVYDRWGQLMFTSKDLNDGWDGKFNNVAQPLGVYVYIIKLINNTDGSPVSKSGNVTLLR